MSKTWYALQSARQAAVTPRTTRFLPLGLAAEVITGVVFDQHFRHISLRKQKADPAHRCVLHGLLRQLCRRNIKMLNALYLYGSSINAWQNYRVKWGLNQAFVIPTGRELVEMAKRADETPGNFPHCQLQWSQFLFSVLSNPFLILRCKKFHMEGFLILQNAFPYFIPVGIPDPPAYAPDYAQGTGHR